MLSYLNVSSNACLPSKVNLDELEEAISIGYQWGESYPGTVPSMHSTPVSTVAEFVGWIWNEIKDFFNGGSRNQAFQLVAKIGSLCAQYQQLTSERLAHDTLARQVTHETVYNAILDHCALLQRLSRSSDARTLYELFQTDHSDGTLSICFPFQGNSAPFNRVIISPPAPLSASPEQQSELNTIVHNDQSSLDEQLASRTRSSSTSDDQSQTTMQDFEYRASTPDSPLDSLDSDYGSYEDETESDSGNSEYQDRIDHEVP